MPSRRQQLGEAFGAIRRAVVGEQSGDAHAELLVVAQRCHQELARAQAFLIRQHQAEAHARVIVDGYMQRLPTGASRILGAVSRDAMAWPLEAAELLHV